MPKRSFAETKKIYSSSREPLSALKEEKMRRGRQYTAAVIALDFWPKFERELHKDPNIKEFTVRYHREKTDTGVDVEVIRKCICKYSPYSEDLEITVEEVSGTVDVTVETPK